MCGAYGFSVKDAKEVYDRFEVVNTLEDLKPRWNVRPGQMNPVITSHSPNQISRMFWGLIPHWAKDEKRKFSTINATAETAAELPTYLDEVMSLPHLTAHGDACPNNLLTTADPAGFTLIDFGFWQPLPAGADLSQLLIGDVQIGKARAGDLAVRDDAHVAAYVQGLRDEGCGIPEPVVRRAHALHMLMMSGLSAVPVLPVTLYRYIECPPARNAPARLGRIATATPRSTSAIPVVRAIHSPRGKSFSAATTAAMSRTQIRPIAPATTSTIISAQQQPRQ